MNVLFKKSNVLKEVWCFCRWKIWKIKRKIGRIMTGIKIFEICKINF